MSDLITLSGIRAFGRHGADAGEKDVPQPFDIDVSLAEIEACAFGGSFVRVHRSWLANLTHVKELRAEGGLTQLFVGTRAGEDAKGMCVPVARDLARTVRETLLASAIGLRRRD